MGKMRAAADPTASPSERGGGAFAFLRDAWAGIRLGRELRSATSNLTEPEPWLLQALLGGPTKSGASVSENAAFNVAVIRTCVSLRANLLASLPLKVYQRTATGPVEQRDHPLARLFRGRVSPAQTRFKWILASSICEDIGGNAYTRVVRDAYYAPARLLWTKPADVTPLHNKRTGDVAYRVAELGDVAAADMVHIAGLTTNGITGRSPIADLRESIGLVLTAEEFTARTFSNGNRKPGLLIPPPGWKKEQAEDFRQAWLQHYAGAHNAGKTPLIGGGMTWQDVGFSNQDAELLGLRKFTPTELSAIYHIPLHLVNSTEKSTAGYGANVEQVNQGLVDYMLAPRCVNWESELGTTLLTEREQEEGYFLKFKVDALLRGSPETRAKVHQIMRSIAALTVNEVRALEDLPTLTEPDGIFDDPRLPLNNQGGGSGNNQPQPAATAAGEEE